ncbi:hypothetical protein GGR55DRAFT_642011 [Xylaria sp. FL0064]|nr:hypothetical protein GGR55DRAFT_642011 [Xylaria sp. FL0064]
MKCSDHDSMAVLAMGKGIRDVDDRSAPTDCRDQVTITLNEDMTIYEAKRSMFRACADTIDQILHRGGTNIYHYTRDFSVFFGGCPSEWLGTQSPPHK